MDKNILDYKYIDFNLHVENMLKYEVDKEKLNFNKLCLMKIENSDMLIGYIGQAKYCELLTDILSQLKQKWSNYENSSSIKLYSIGTDVFALAANDGLAEEEFLILIENLKNFFLESQNTSCDTPILIRFVVICGGTNLLERAYSQLEHHRHSQIQIITEGTKPTRATLLSKELNTINIIQTAISKDEVIPYYQGLYNNEKKCIDKYEALVRIFDENGNILNPNDFMSVAKRYHLYLNFNLKMFQAVLRDFNGLDYEVSINLSAHDIASPKFLYELEEGLKNFEKPSNLIFEILEDENCSDKEVLNQFIKLVRSYGAKIAIDDFGVGYSNFSAVINIRPDYVKIDGEIIKEIHKSEYHEEIVKAIVPLCRHLGIKIIAEYVENEEIQKVIEQHDISYSQGYYFSKPKPFSELFKDK